MKAEVRIRLSHSEAIRSKGLSDQKCDCCSTKIEEGERCYWVNRQNCIDQLPEHICEKWWEAAESEEEVRSLVEAQKGDEEVWLVKSCRSGCRTMLANALNNAAKMKD